MADNTIKIGGELESMATGKIVAAASAIKDKTRNKTQETINGDVETAIAEQSAQFEALSEETSAAVASASQSARDAKQYLADLQEAITELPDGQAVSAQVAVNEVDIAGLKSDVVVDLSTRYATSYANLSAALTALNSDTAADATAIKKSGVSIKFINSSTNKYEQWNLKASSWSTNTSNWTLDADGSVTNGKLKLPFELEKPSSNEYVTQSSEIGHNGEPLDKTLEGLDNISKESTQSEEDAIIYETNGGTQVGKIDANGADFANLKRGGQQVARMSDLPTVPTLDTSIDSSPSNSHTPSTKAVKDYVDANIPEVPEYPIETESTSSDTEEVIFGNDAGTQQYVKVSSEGVRAVAYNDMQGNNVIPVKDISIGNNPSNTNVPTTKAVKDYVDAKSMPEEPTDEISEEVVFEGEEVTTKVTDKGVVIGNSLISPKINDLNNSEICDYYAINSNGSVVADNNYGCSSYIECENIKSMDISFIQEPTVSGYGIAFYDKNKSLMEFLPNKVGEKKRVIENVEIPEYAVFFKATYFNYADSKTYGEFYCDIRFYSKRKNIHEPKFFSVEVNQAPNRFWDNTDATEIATDYKKTTGVLWLPATYTQNGKPTPLIIYFHGASHYVYYGTWGATSSFYNQKKYWVDRGYAVMDCNGMKDNNKIRILGFGCPQNIDAYHKCFEYVVQNYNVQDKAFLIGASHGNLTAMNYAYSYPSEILKLAILSGATSIQHEAAKAPTEFASIATDYYGTDGTYDNDKFNGFDPIKRVLSIDNNEFIFCSPCQIKALLGANEISESEFGTGGNIYKNLIKVINSLRNSKQIADVRIIEGESHNIVSGNVVSVDEEILRWFNK